MPSAQRRKGHLSGVFPLRSVSGWSVGGALPYVGHLIPPFVSENGALCLKTYSLFLAKSSSAWCCETAVSTVEPWHGCCCFFLCFFSICHSGCFSQVQYPLLEPYLNHNKKNNHGLSPSLDVVRIKSFYSMFWSSKCGKSKIQTKTGVSRAGISFDPLPHDNIKAFDTPACSFRTSQTSKSRQARWQLEKVKATLPNEPNGPKERRPLSNSFHLPMPS